MARNYFTDGEQGFGMSKLLERVPTYPFIPEDAKLSGLLTDGEYVASGPAGEMSRFNTRGGVFEQNTTMPSAGTAGDGTGGIGAMTRRQAEQAGQAAAPAAPAQPAEPSAEQRAAKAFWAEVGGSSGGNVMRIRRLFANPTENSKESKRLRALWESKLGEQKAADAQKRQEAFMERRFIEAPQIRTETTVAGRQSVADTQQETALAGQKNALNIQEMKGTQAQEQAKINHKNDIALAEKRGDIEMAQKMLEIDAAGDRLNKTLQWKAEQYAITAQDLAAQGRNDEAEKFLLQAFKTSNDAYYAEMLAWTTQNPAKRGPKPEPPQVDWESIKAKRETLPSETTPAEGQGQVQAKAPLAEADLDKDGKISTTEQHIWEIGNALATRTDLTPDQIKGLQKRAATLKAGLGIMKSVQP